MKKERLVDTLLALEEKYWKLMLDAEKEKDDFARGQYYAMVVAYSNAAKIVASDEYAESVRKELGADDEA